MQTLQRSTAPVAPSTTYGFCDDTLASCAVQRTTLARGATSASGFTYYATDGSVLTPAALAASTTRDTVASVDVRVAVSGTASTARTSASGGTTVLTRVQLVNQDAYRLGKP